MEKKASLVCHCFSMRFGKSQKDFISLGALYPPWSTHIMLVKTFGEYASSASGRTAVLLQLKGKGPTGAPSVDMDVANHRILNARGFLG